MSSQENSDDMFPEEGESRDAERDNDSVASKLSKELSNWRRRRTAARPGHNDGPSGAFKSESARTIKVRGHETLVIRKPKLAGKPPGSVDGSGR